jgi:hypothetical protein
MTKVQVTNVADRVVERLGHYFQPKQEVEIELQHPNHLALLAACRYLQVEKIDKPAPTKKQKK